MSVDVELGDQLRGVDLLAALDRSGFTYTTAGEGDNKRCYFFVKVLEWNVEFELEQTWINDDPDDICEPDEERLSQVYNEELEGLNDADAKPWIAKLNKVMQGSLCAPSSVLDAILV